MDAKIDESKNVPGWVTLLAAVVVVGFGVILYRFLSPVDTPQVTATPLPTISPLPAKVSRKPIYTPAPKKSITKVELVRYRVVRFQTAQGIDANMVMIDLKNTGTTSVRVVKADIEAYDESGRRLESSVKDYTIYAAASSAPGIKPGRTFRRKPKEGFVLLPFYGIPAKVKVRITSAAEYGKYI